jgi:hypothetical protein
MTHKALVILSLLIAAAGCSGDSGSAEATADADLGCDTVFYADTDGDGHGDADETTTACEVPEGYVAVGDDCDDDSDAVHPGLPEVCDGLDNDCNGLKDSDDPAVDLASQREYYRDVDGDGYGRAGDTTTSCDKPAGYALEGTDCDDSDADIHPEADEICDFYDNDCDGLYDDEDDSLDPSSAESFYLDSDGDGYGTGTAVMACTRPAQHASQDGDCDDSEAAAHPGAVETCDQIDNDCDGAIDGPAGSGDLCGPLAGSFSGSYQIRALEKAGSIVVNNMTCNGTAALTIDVTASPAVQGTVSCTRVGSIILFDENQSGMLTGSINPDGSVSGTLVHTYNGSLTRSYSFAGALSGDQLVLTGTGSLLPHPMSTVPWEVDFTMDMSR